MASTDLKQVESVFDFRDLRRFAGKSAAIKRPQEITQFSFDDQHVCHPLSDAGLKYYYPPLLGEQDADARPRFDLSRGLDTFVKYDENTDLHIDALLETIQAHETKCAEKIDADIVTWRGMMTKILSAPFDGYGEFEMNATKFEGTIYIEENKAPIFESMRKNQGQAPRQYGPFPQSTMMYWGYKFEVLSTLPRPWAECSREEIEDRDAQVVDTHAQYCSIVRTGIGNHTIVLGGEVDCVKGEKPDDGSGHSIPYVELKTSESFNGHDSRAAEKFEKKMCRFWAQSFLLGVPTIIIGFRSSHGILEGVEEWETQRIPGFVQNRGMRTWDGNVCINFAAAFLDFLKQTISSAPSGEDGTWLIKRRKGAKEITITRTSEVLDPQIVTPAFRMHRENLKPSLDSEPTAS